MQHVNMKNCDFVVVLGSHRRVFLFGTLLLKLGKNDVSDDVSPIAYNT